MRSLNFILIGLFFLSSYGQTPNNTPHHRYLAEDQGLPESFPDLPNAVHVFQQVDSIMTAGIEKRAFPGAQLLVAKNGKIVFYKPYGFHTYDSLTPVNKTDIYDLASITKIAASTLAIMKLVDEGKLNLDLPFSTCWKPWKKYPDKKDLTLREILAHQAGLEPYIVFLKSVMRKGKLKSKFARRREKSSFQSQAYDELFIKTRFKKKVYRMINRSKVDETKAYRYSGLTFLLFPQIVEDLSGQTFEDYLQTNFYDPLGCTTLGFNPKLKNFENAIVPTEIDSVYRKSLTRGWVHDENASLMGGISGNAGLFGQAKDLFILMQMLVNKGTYKEKRYLSEKVVSEFIKIQYPENENRRGLGFDKPLINNATFPLPKAYPAPEASTESFGHSGFTGTFVWGDPKNQLVFIFLSNRVYPFRSQRNLYELNIRSSLHQVFYKVWDSP